METSTALNVRSQDAKIIGYHQIYNLYVIDIVYFVIIYAIFSINYVKCQISLNTIERTRFVEL